MNPFSKRSCAIYLAVIAGSLPISPWPWIIPGVLLLIVAFILVEDR